MELEVRKAFHTRKLIGENIVVVTKIGQRISGEMLEYFEKNNAIVVRNFKLWDTNSKGKLEIVDEGDIIILKGDAWCQLICPKYTKV